jgi:cytochrome P450
MPEPEDLERLAFTRMVVQESLRLYPPVPWFGRVALGPDRIADYDVPPGTTVLLSPYVMQRHPLYWDYPEHFVPERFAPAKMARRPLYLYFPFGGGPRTCIGSHLALMEMQVVMAVLMRRFRLHPATPAPVEPRPGAEPRPGMAMRPSDAMAMHVERRIGIVKS